jgi:DNA processing protein
MPNERQILERLGACALRPGEPGYPAGVAQLSDAPTLYVRGTLPARPAVAIVGSRAASREGRDTAVALAAALVRAGRGVVSGGAIGIDTAAHKGALEAGGGTVAVLGSGLDDPYPPQNHELLDRIARAGALVSPFSPRTPPRRWHFPRRNRVIAALGTAVVVVEASLRSGSLITARVGFELGRAVFAVPGTPGCHRLIVEGALPIDRAEALIAALEGRAPPRAHDRRARSAGAARLLATLGAQPCDPDALAQAAGLKSSEASVALLELELDGLAVRAPGGYVRGR